MSHLLLDRWLQHVRASWRGQLVVLAVTACMLVPILHGIAGSSTLVPRVAVAAVALLVSWAAAAHVAWSRPSRRQLVREARDLAVLLPRLVSQALVAVAPLAVAVVVALQLASFQPLLGLLLVLPVFALAAVTFPLVALSVVSVVRGDGSWIPRAAWHAVRGAPLQITAAGVSGGTIAAFAALPAVTTAALLATQPGLPGLLGPGLGVAAIMPLLGCGALALWQSSDAGTHMTGRGASGPVPAAADGFGTSGPLAAGGTTPGWSDGPCWDATLEPGAVWGTWLRLEHACQVGLRIRWSGAAAPRLAIGSEGGTWVAPGDPHEPGDVVAVVLPAGNSYIQVASRGAAIQAVSVAVLVPAAAAA